jgi:hypothetical protein
MSVLGLIGVINIASGLIIIIFFEMISKKISELNYMHSQRLKKNDVYSLARHNCRTYSQWEFRDAPKNW